MRYTVKIDDHRYAVEIGDLHSRPIIATINGESFEVWPEAENGRVATPPPQNGAPSELPRHTPAASPPPLAMNAAKSSAPPSPA
ncbi:MAG: hypothetical protein M5U34_05475 [Chloroflexi bacterium]|nr:hypothetical protein [Chloroflexota bacterium]